MRQKSSKIKKQAILERAKSAKPDRRNYTFRLPEDLMEQFEKTCDKEGVNRTQVLEELIKSFLSES